MNVGVELISDLQQQRVSAQLPALQAATTAACRRWHLSSRLWQRLPGLSGTADAWRALLLTPSLPAPAVPAALACLPAPPGPAGPHPQRVCAGSRGPWQDHAVRPPDRLQWPHPPQAGRGGQVRCWEPGGKSCSSHAGACWHSNQARARTACHRRCLQRCCQRPPLLPPNSCAQLTLFLFFLSFLPYAGTWTARRMSRSAASR